MYDRTIRYLASIFVDAESVVATPELSEQLLEALEDDRFLPVPAIEEGSGGRVRRLFFHAPEQGWRLLIGGKRFDLSLHPINAEGSNLIPFAGFCDEAKEKLTRVVQFLERRGHRLACVREGLLSEMDPENMDAINRRLMQLPESLGTPFEWDWKAAFDVERSFGGITETTNTIATVKRGTGHMVIGEDEELEAFDRIRVDLDINTKPDNVKARFGVEELASFFSSMQAWQEDLERDVLSFVHGETA